MFNRRRFLEGKLALAGAWSALQKAAAEPVARDFFKELGVREFINAAEPFTAEIQSIARRVQAGDLLASDEWKRLAGSSPVIDGELTI